MYHLDPFSREPMRCTFAMGACPVAPYDQHYCNISEAVRLRPSLEQKKIA